MDEVFRSDAGLGKRLFVYVSEGRYVHLSDPDREAAIAITKADWEQIVAQVKEHIA